MRILPESSYNRVNIICQAIERPGADNQIVKSSYNRENIFFFLTILHKL